jgi:hypothetical protein
MPQLYINVENFRVFVEMAGLVIAVIALIVGIRHVRELKHQVKELKKQTEQAQAHARALDVLRRELPTRYIGQFPDYLQEIVNLFDKAEREIVAFCDFPAYGSFTSPKKFLKYRQKLEQKLADNLPVQLTCLDKSGRMKVTRKQFLRKPWNQWTADPQNKDQLEWFLKHHDKDTKVSEEEFISLLEEDDGGMLQIMRGAGAKVFEVNKDMPLYYWVVDNQEAIFAIIVLSERAVEYGFRTSDQKLINALNEMRQQYCADGLSKSIV